jgi:hypothetical protein
MHLRSLVVRHFGMVEATELKSEYQVTFMVIFMKIFQLVQKLLMENRQRTDKRIGRQQDLYEWH